jgi:hypothetical protein
MAFPLIVSPMTLIVVDNRSRLQGLSEGSGRGVSDMQIAGQFQLNQMEISVGTESDHYPTSHETRSGTCVSAGQQGSYKAHEVSFNVDVESVPEEK